MAAAKGGGKNKKKARKSVQLCVVLVLIVFPCSMKGVVTVAFVGEPGTGKSTILSSLVGQPGAFPSGPSGFVGMTKKVASKVKDGVTYFDTPGLLDADQKRREEIAKEISLLFKAGGEFKIIFVVACPTGRLDANHLTTMKLFLEAIPRLNCFGIILNNLPEVVMGAGISVLMTKFVQRMVPGALPTVLQIRTVMTAFQLFNSVLPETIVQDINNFISIVPSVKLDPNEARDVQISEFDALKTDMEKKLGEKNDELKALETKLFGLQKKVEEDHKNASDAEKWKLYGAVVQAAAQLAGTTLTAVPGIITVTK
jgi:hypothetical protein